MLCCSYRGNNHPTSLVNVVNGWAIATGWIDVYIDLNYRWDDAS
jgi:hypothetical protein